MQGHTFLLYICYTWHSVLTISLNAAWSTGFVISAGADFCFKFVSEGAENISDRRQLYQLARVSCIQIGGQSDKSVQCTLHLR